MPVNHQPTEHQMLAQIQQLGATIEQLQNRLEQLNPETTPTASIAPTIRTATTPAPRQPTTPHLPDWSEPELRPHYTLEESANAYAAIEALHNHRKLQTAAAEEVDAAHAVADRLRQYSPPTARPRRRPRHTTQHGAIA
ncbi:MAG: hypothetical protein HC805_05940, partial [Alkalinema sp. RL_2_19]|nr:hypothetical protein [Alkalinema sp. RL_2_19]